MTGAQEPNQHAGSPGPDAAKSKCTGSRSSWLSAPHSTTKAPVHLAAGTWAGKQVALRVKPTKLGALIPLFSPSKFKRDTRD